MFKDNEKLKKQIEELDIKYHRVCTALAKHLNIVLQQKDIIVSDWYNGSKKIDYEYEIVLNKKEKKTIKKKNKKSKK